MDNTQKTETESTYTVNLSDGATANVKLSGNEIVIDLGLYREAHSLESLTNAARRNQLPAWVQQVPGLLAKIDKRFADELKHGKNPYEWIGFSDGEIRVTDLRHGTSVSGKIVDIKRQYAETGVLPKAFSSKRTRQLLGIEQEAQHG